MADSKTGPRLIPRESWKDKTDKKAFPRGHIHFGEGAKRVCSMGLTEVGLFAQCRAQGKRGNPAIPLTT